MLEQVLFQKRAKNIVTAKMAMLSAMKKHKDNAEFIAGAKEASRMLRDAEHAHKLGEDLYCAISLAAAEIRLKVLLRSVVGQVMAVTNMDPMDIYPLANPEPSAS